MLYRSQEEIISYWKFDNRIPVVSIKCTAYNQENYIAQTIEGFLIQKTEYPFEVVIHDDASTDKTAAIIKQYELLYPKIIKPIYELENQYSKRDGSLTRIVDEHCKGKYMAICEGDDYWCDENKIQREVSYLEKHKSFGLCYSKAKSYIQISNTFSNEIGSSNATYKNLFVYGNRIPTLTTCFRTDLYYQYRHEVKPQEQRNWLMGDLPMWLWFSRNTKIKFFPTVMAVYRVLQNSASHFTNAEAQKKFNQSSDDIRLFYSNKYDEPKMFEQYKKYWAFYHAWQNRDRKEILQTGKLFLTLKFNLKIVIKVCIAKNNRIFKILCKN